MAPTELSTRTFAATDPEDLGGVEVHVPSSRRPNDVQEDRPAGSMGRHRFEMAPFVRADDYV